MGKRGKTSGKAASQADAPTDRDRRDFRRLVRKAGGEEKLSQWIGRKAPRASGRPRNDFFKDFSVSDGPNGLKVVRFKIGNAAPMIVAIVRPKAHRVKPGGPTRTWVESQHGDFPTTHQAIGDIVRRLWAMRAELDQAQTFLPDLGWHPKAITRRVTRELRKAAKSQK
jgi:hypothetical protein